MKFYIKGTHHPSGRTKRIAVDAESEKEALAFAKEKDITPATVFTKGSVIEQMRYEDVSSGKINVPKRSIPQNLAGCQLDRPESSASKPSSLKKVVSERELLAILVEEAKETNRLLRPLYGIALIMLGLLVLQFLTGFVTMVISR